MGVDAVERCVVEHSHHLGSAHSFSVLVGYRQRPLLLLTRLQLVAESSPFQLQPFVWTHQVEALYHAVVLPVAYIEDVHFDALAPFLAVGKAQVLHCAVSHTHLMVNQPLLIIYSIDDIGIGLTCREVDVSRSALRESVLLRIDEVLFCRLILWTELVVHAPSTDFRDCQRRVERREACFVIHFCAVRLVGLHSHRIAGTQCQVLRQEDGVA